MHQELIRPSQDGSDTLNVRRCHLVRKPHARDPGAAFVLVRPFLFCSGGDRGYSDRWLEPRFGRHPPRWGLRREYGHSQTSGLPVNIREFVLRARLTTC